MRALVTSGVVVALLAGLGLVLASCSPYDGVSDGRTPGPTFVEIPPVGGPMASRQTEAPPQPVSGRGDRAGDVSEGGAPGPTFAVPTPVGRPAASREAGAPPQLESDQVEGSGIVSVEVVAEGLEVPWAVAFTPDGRILVTERAGRIRVVQDGVLLESPFATVEAASISESGLMGIALHPDFAANGQLFVCYTYRADGGRLVNRVARLTDVDGLGVDHHVILDGIPGASRHDGCGLGFGPDGKLYITMGDAVEPERAQDLNSLSGKVLRLDPDGGIPGDNPFPDSPIYTYGHRNPQGLAWHPDTGDLFITEHGPASEDEVNILEAGQNYGWPVALGPVEDPRYIDPILSFTPTLALSGAAFYVGDTLPEEWRGNFIFATLRSAHLHRVVLKAPDFRTVESHQRLFQGRFGRLRAVAMSPDGHLYFTTSNRDGRGQPRPGDDKLLRLIQQP